MKTKNIILDLRTKKGMSQDELADKIMVTRQAAVSYTHLRAVRRCPAGRTEKPYQTQKR